MVLEMHLDVLDCRKKIMIIIFSYINNMINWYLLFNTTVSDKTARIPIILVNDTMRLGDTCLCICSTTLCAWVWYLCLDKLGVNVTVYICNILRLGYHIHPQSTTYHRHPQSTTYHIYRYPQSTTTDHSWHSYYDWPILVYRRRKNKFLKLLSF